LSLPVVSIHYDRPHRGVQVFQQSLVHDGGDHLVTFVPATDLPRPVVAVGRVILEPGSPVVWFTYPGRWYDIGRFHLADGTFTGFYANILTPVRIEGDDWYTTDLFLDVFVAPEGGVTVLDEEELAEAEIAGWVGDAVAAEARRQAAALERIARGDGWPPPHVVEWTLERARRALG
jgi:predicted RNA-binding protein associated with RNAse of E/G family